MSVQIIGIAPCYNESSKGHLDRFLLNIPKVVDGLVLLDDASTDDSYEKMKSVTPHVIRNTSNMFLEEQNNTNALIKKALEVYPDLTHILTLNIDSTFSPNTFKDGDAIIHKLMLEHPEVGMWTGRNVHLWRSDWWYRSDKDWGFDCTERVYVRAHSLELAHLNRRGLHQGKITTAKVWRNINEFYYDYASLHWGFFSKKLIVDKFNYYMSKEKYPVPNPPDFKHRNVFKLLNEYELKLTEVDEKWIDPEVKMSDNKNKPKPISYYSHICEYDFKQAEKYRVHFEKTMKYHTEDEAYYDLPEM